MNYRVQDTTTDDPNAFELKADGEARPRNDGTTPARFSSLEDAEAKAKEFRGMDVVADYEGV
jgi:hypothetical protein